VVLLVPIPAAKVSKPVAAVPEIAKVV